MQQNGGKVYREGPEFTLLIDIKSDGETTYAALAKLLAEYEDVFSPTPQGTCERRAVTAIISGNRPYESIASSSPRFAGIDGRLSDLGSTHAPETMPLISDNWRSHFKWRGSGEISTDELTKLKQLVVDVHREGRRIRFWATPDTPNAWKVFQDAGVDLINTDDLSGLGHFLRQN